MIGETKQLKNGHWFARIYSGRVNGQRRYVAKTHATKKEADAWVAEMQHAKNQGASIVQSRMTLEAYLRKWLEVSIKATVKSRTYDGYTELLKKHVMPTLGQRPLAKLHALDIQACYNQMTAAGLSPRTVQYTAMILKQALKDAVEHRMLTFNPATGAKVPKQKRRGMLVFNPDQARRFLAVAKMTPQWGPLFSVALTTGMRPSEYLALRWGDIDFDRRTATVQRSVDQTPDGSWVFSDNKTKGSRRTIRLHMDVTETLKQYKLRQGTADQGAMDSALVFSTRNGTPHERGNVKRAFRTIIKKAKRMSRTNRRSCRCFGFTICATLPPRWPWPLGSL